MSIYAVIVSLVAAIMFFLYIRMTRRIRLLRNEVVQLKNINSGLTKRQKLEDHIDIQLESNFPMLEIVTDKRGQVRENPMISAISDPCKQFFGLAPTTTASKFVGKSTKQVMMDLEKLINPPSSHWQDLVVDQSRVLNDLAESIEPVARYPVIFNNKHPYYKSKSFIPLVTETRTVTDMKDNVREFMRILYLDTSKLPRYVLRHEIDETLKRSINREVLQAELKALIEHLKPREGEHGTRENVEVIQQALTNLEEGASLKVVECFAKIGFFALLDIASELKLDHIKALVNGVING